MHGPADSRTQDYPAGHGRSGLIRNHIHKEENILFEAAHRCLSAEQDDRVVTEIKNFKSTRRVSPISGGWNGRI